MQSRVAFSAIRQSLRSAASSSKQAGGQSRWTHSAPSTLRSRTPVFVGMAAATFALAAYANLLTNPVLADSKHPDSAAGIAHMAGDDGMKLISAKEIAEHTSREAGLWVVIDGVVWDVTDFVDNHPGGSKIIIQNCGKDATALFKSLHPPNAIEENLDPSKRVGVVDPSTMSQMKSSVTDVDEKIQKARDNMMGVEGMVNLDDFEDVCREILTPPAWAYYASGSDDEWTMHQNRDAYRKIRFRPRVLNKVKEVSTESEILGVKTKLPIFIAPAALAKLGHPLGEVNLTRGAGETGIMQVISSNASCSMDELAAEKVAGQELGWQFYVAADRDRAHKTLKKACDLGMQSIWLTVDAPVGGKRERDMKEKISRDPPKKDAKKDPDAVSTSAVQFAYVDPNLCWDDLKWIKEESGGRPLVIKGISCVEDAILAHEHGVQGIVLSNHGGRQLDGARPPIQVLQEIRNQRPDLLEKMEVFVDGGVRRGTDVLKALCLGAKAVGLGRPFLYAQSAYGADGVVKAVEIMEEEIATGMRLLGVTKISDLKPSLVECLPPS